ncbi:MAG: phosphoribosylformylglycinamidine synthase II [Micavibrio sp.]|nr:phosphoribosylformylglycinamidine synthase II [Micavibrio sp.]
MKDVKEPEVNAELAKSFGLNTEEYGNILDILGRDPSYTELGIFSVMWSEHCSYKSSRLHLKKLPTEAPHVIQGPGENAGVIDIGDNQAAVFKMESHNHPSYIEPFQGAATGVGGIMRDVFTMGARPVANINALRFGSPEHPKTRSLINGVVAGISHYGNCMGVPTVGGETEFHESYNGNILVNAMTVGVADQDKIYYARGAKPNMPIVYIGSKTGRDGIHGATMASAEFDDNSAENRPTVQVGDPFAEKLLLEACLELMDMDVIVSIQDMGAAGLTSSSVEIADKGEIGVHLNLDDVPQRELNMLPYEIMLSESQERMLMILKPGSEEQARAVFDKWDLDFAVIGETTQERQLKLSMYGRDWCDIPVPPLVDKAPVYDRPHTQSPKPKSMPSDLPWKNRSMDKLLEDLITLVGKPNFASKRWIWEQYDSLVMGRTVFSPGITNTQSLKAADAALVIVEGTQKALAITSDCTPRYCFANPHEGGKQAVAESYRNISATGATPLAVTNNLNFGNPERPEIMAQFVGCIEGIAEACGSLSYPVISGNVSLYNETNGQGIFPTPVIGGVGLIQDYAAACGLAFRATDEIVYMVGAEGTHLGQSLYAKDVFDVEAGEAPSVDLSEELKNGEFIRDCIQSNTLSACHDISGGGLMTALAEMAMASKNIGVKIEAENISPEFWFGEDQSRYVVSVAQANRDSFEKAAMDENISIQKLGKTVADMLVFDTHNIKVADLISSHEDWLPAFMDKKTG